MTDETTKKSESGQENKCDDNTTQIKNDNAKIDALARKIRHIGYAFCVLLALALSGFLIASLVDGMQNGQVFDPFTGETVH